MLDRMIRNQGVDVTHTYVADASYTDFPESFDQSNSDITSETVKAYVTKPTEEEVNREGGRGLTIDLKLVVDESVDVEEQRGGRNDRFTVGINDNGRELRVEKIEEDVHPFRSVLKQNVFCSYTGDR